MQFVHVINLCEGSEIIRALVSNFHPRRILCSSSVASAFSFDNETKSTLLIESFWSTGCPTRKMARRTAAAPHVKFVPKSRMIVVRSPM